MNCLVEGNERWSMRGVTTQDKWSDLVVLWILVDSTNYQLLSQSKDNLPVHHICECMFSSFLDVYNLAKLPVSGRNKFTDTCYDQLSFHIFWMQIQNCTTPTVNVKYILTNTPRVDWILWVGVFPSLILTFDGPHSHHLLCTCNNYFI